MCVNTLQVSYGIVPSVDAEAFMIDASSGVVTSTRELDRDTKSEYQLTVQASDDALPPLTGLTTVTVYVTSRLNGHSQATQTNHM